MRVPRELAKALSIVLAGAWVYAPCLKAGWLWDDDLEVYRNGALRSPGGWWEAWVHPQGMDYFPLKGTLQWVEWHLWGAHPAGYHAVNVLLHIAGALLVWRLLALLGLRAAALGGLLFAVHPVAVESVAWVSEFKNTLSLPPLLLSCIAFVRYQQDGRRRRLAGALGWFVAALLCKTSVVMLPFVLLLYCWWLRGRLARRDLYAAAPFLGAALVLGAVTVVFQSSRAIGIAGTPESLAARLAQAGWSVLAYLRTCVWPAGLEPVYPPAAASWTALLPWLAMGAGLALLWRRRAGWGRHALLGLGWFLLNLVPVLGVIPMSYMRVSPRADHFAYVPLVGIVGLAAAAFGAGLSAWRRRKGAASAGRLPFAAAAMAVVALLAVDARAYAAVFADEKTLWSAAVNRNPDAWVARSGLGKAFLEEGRAAEASRQLREAVRLRPDSFESLAELGNSLEAQGLPEEARRQYAAALAVNPLFAGAHYDLGVSLLRSRQFPGAEREFREALRLDAAYATARNNLGLALYGEGDLPGAMDQYRAALALEPQLPEAHLNLGNALFRLGRTLEAVAEYRSALLVDPGYSGAHLNLAAALDELGQHEEAQAERDAAQRTARH